jgi:hypothetical protein
MVYSSLEQEIKTIKKKNKKNLDRNEGKNTNKNSNSYENFPIQKKSYDFANARTISETTNIQDPERFTNIKRNSNLFGYCFRNSI